MAGTDLTNQEKLEEIYKLTQENNHMLHGMRNRERVANAFKILYWIVIIGSLLGAYYYVKPLISVFVTNKDKMDQTLSQFGQLQRQFPEMKMIQQIMEKIKGSSSPQTATTTVAP